MEVRKEDGSLYKKTSLTALRFGLQREIKKIRPDLNIIDYPAFQSSSEIFKAQCIQLKLGQAKVDHKSQISKADMELLHSSGVFSATKPLSLQRKVFFEVMAMLYLCRRGRENLRMLDKDSFGVKEFPDGKKYVVYTTDELRKTNV